MGVDTPFWQHTANSSGGSPRLPTMDAPRKMVDAIVRVSANVVHKWQIKTAPPAPPASGTLHEPMQAGRTVEGGVRERIEREGTLGK